MGCDPFLLERVIKDSGLSYSETRSSYVLTCPKCNKRKKLYIRKTDGIFCCWVCRTTDGFQGKPEYALSELIGCSVREAIGMLYEDELDSPPNECLINLDSFFQNGEVPEDVKEIMPSLRWPFDYFKIDDEKSYKGLAYLESRGVPKEVAIQYDIRYCPQERRVIFPVKTISGELLGWQGRLTFNPQKYIDEKGELTSSLKIKSSDSLNGIRDRVLMFAERLVGSNHAVLSEGPFDGVKLHLVGGNVATMGKSVSVGQLNLIKNYGIKKLYIALDPDAAEEVIRVVRDFYSDFELYNMFDIPNKDIGEMSFKEAYEVFLSSKKINGGNLFIFLG